MLRHHQREVFPGRETFAFLLAVILLVGWCVISNGQTVFPTGEPVVAKNADGRLEVFQINGLNGLRYRWQRETDRNWSPWSLLGGAFLPEIAAAETSDGQLEVFAIDRKTKKVKYTWQKTPNEQNWPAFATLEGGKFEAPVTIGTDSQGRIEIFAVDAATREVMCACQTNFPDGWTAWTNLGGGLEPRLAAARDKDGSLEIFGVNAQDGSLGHRVQSVAGDWSPWASLGNAIEPGFAVGQDTDGRLEVFAVNRTNSAVNRIQQTFSGTNVQWTTWVNFGGKVKAGITTGKNADGRLEIFAVDDRDATLLHKWQLTAGGSPTVSWSGWYSMSGAIRPFPALGQNADGNLEIFAIDRETGTTLVHKRQISQNSEWLDWLDMDHPTFQYRSRTWQIDEGLPHNAVQAIAQTQDGYLWVATHKGLVRFDGLQFKAIDETNFPELKNGSINALCADLRGTLWIGTDSAGLIALNGGTFRHFGKVDGLAGDKIKTISEGKDGSLWIGTMTGLSRYRNGHFTNYGEKDGLSSDLISYIFEDQTTNLWIATGNGLNRLKADGGIESFAMPAGPPNDSVRCIYQDKGGRIWIGSDNGLLWYNPYRTAATEDFYAYNTRYGLSDNFVSAICEDNLGNLWVGTYSGLNRFREGRFFNEPNNEGMPLDKVNALFEDHEGNLWVGAREGLIRLTPKRFTSYTRQEGLSHNNVMSMMEDRSGDLWIASWGGGVDRLKNGRITPYPNSNGLPGRLILSLCESRDGSMWVGAEYENGLSHIKDGRITRYTWKDGLPPAAVRVIYEDNSGTTWAGTSRGLSYFTNGEFVTYTVKDGLAGDVVRAMCEDDSSNLWIGTEGGLSCRHDGHFINYTTKNGLSDNVVLALYPDREKNLWIGTANGGLLRYHEGRFTAYTTRQGLFSDEIFEILEDDHGWLWMSCSKGIFRVRKRDLASLDQGETTTIGCIVYGRADGMESSFCNGVSKPAAWKSRDGRLWFATSKGLVSIDPNTTKINRESSPVYIEDVVDQRNVIPASPLISPPAWEFASGVLIHNTNQTPVVIPPSRGELQFHYTAINLQAPEKSLFKYKLEGFDPDWIDAGARHVAYYNNINPGRYLFRVQACNRDGIWNEAGASLALILLPHFWQTWWFRALIVLGTVGVIAGSARFSIRKKMQRKLERLQQQNAVEKERARIGKDIHDDLGSSLTRIMMLGERAEEGLARHEEISVHIRKIVDSARQTVQSMEEIVWAVNPENDTLNSLMEYIGHFVDEFFENSEMACHLEMPVDLPALTLPAEMRHDLFLVVKEALNNVMKHSHATEVSVKVAVAGPELEVVIKDNGTGFDAREIAEQNKGCGLKNMTRRVENLGGRLNISTTPNGGTALSLALKLNAITGAI